MVDEIRYIVYVIDAPEQRTALCDALRSDGYEVFGFDTLGSALEQQGEWDNVCAVLLNRQLPDATEEEALPRLAQRARNAALIVMTGLRDADGAIAALRLGAADYLLKPIHPDALRASIARIRDRWRMAEELEKNNARMRAILNTAVDGIVTADAKGVIESVNPAAERMFGYKARELVGRTVNMLMPSPYRDEHDQYITRYLETGEKRIIGIGREVTALRKDGSTMSVDLAVSEIRWDHHRYFVAMIRDLTDRKRLEREILTISETEQRRIGQDLHDDLGQQLTGIAFLTKVLQRSLEAKGVAEAADAQKVTNLVEHAISHTRRLVRGLSPIDLDGTTLLEAVQRFASDIEDVFGIRCELDWRQRRDIADQDVKTHLYRIVQEAVHNAVRHGKAGRVTISMTERDRFVTLTVTDNGSGLPDKIPAGRGAGLRNMRHRARVIGATITIRRASKKDAKGGGVGGVAGGAGSGGGTVVTCSFHNHIPTTEGDLS